MDGMDGCTQTDRLTHTYNQTSQSHSQSPSQSHRIGPIWSCTVPYSYKGVFTVLGDHTVPLYRSFYLNGHLYSPWGPYRTFTGHSTCMVFLEVRCCTVLYTVLYGAVRSCTVQYGPVRCCTVLYGAVRSCTVLYGPTNWSIYPRIPGP